MSFAEYVEYKTFFSHLLSETQQTTEFTEIASITTRHVDTFSHR